MFIVQVPEPLEGSQMRRIYSAYPGTGSVYSVIAKSGRSAVAYVPSLTYACSTVYWTDTCDVLSELTIIISHWYNLLTLISVLTKLFLFQIPFFQRFYVLWFFSLVCLSVCVDINFSRQKHFFLVFCLEV